MASLELLLFAVDSMVSNACQRLFYYQKSGWTQITWRWLDADTADVEREEIAVLPFCYWNA